MQNFRCQYKNEQRGICFNIPVKQELKSLMSTNFKPVPYTQKMSHLMGDRNRQKSADDKYNWQSSFTPFSSPGSQKCKSNEVWSIHSITLYPAISGPVPTPDAEDIKLTGQKCYSNRASQAGG